MKLNKTFIFLILSSLSVFVIFLIRNYSFADTQTIVSSNQRMKSTLGLLINENGQILKSLYLTIAKSGNRPKDVEVLKSGQKVHDLANKATMMVDKYREIFDGYSFINRRISFPGDISVLVDSLNLKIRSINLCASIESIDSIYINDNRRMVCIWQTALINMKYKIRAFENNALKNLSMRVGAEDIKFDAPPVNVKYSEKKEVWKRSAEKSNQTRLSIGDNEDLPLKGIQVAIQIDGFRARILMDLFYYNDRSSAMEGAFKLKLPNEASPYYFAFGETVLIDEDTKGIPFVDYKSTSDKRKLDPEYIKKARSSLWTQPVEARVVPKNNAAYAYLQTVRQSIDPALMEWVGADVFSCSVFPLMPGKLHRMVIGYDVNLADINGDKLLNYIIPKDTVPTIIDIDIAGETFPLTNFRSKGERIAGRIKYHLEEPKVEELQIRFPNMEPSLLQSPNQDKEVYFGASFNINLPEAPVNNIDESAVFMIDISLSSNPDRFNIWLKLISAILKNNQNKIKNFAVLFFNIETFWYKKEFISNSEKNVAELLKYANTLTLEGASDIEVALQEANLPEWQNGKHTPANLFLISDGSVTWGEGDVFSLGKIINSQDKLFTYKTGLSGTDNHLLEQLAQLGKGASFTVTGEDELLDASQAFKNKSWKLDSIILDGSKDALIAGRPEYFYPGQQIILTGRGQIKNSSVLTLLFSQDDLHKEIKVKFDHPISSPLAKRIYGQIAVNQLENFEDINEEYAQAYASHFQVPGKAASFLMLESEEDYELYDLDPKENERIVKTSTINKIIGDIKQEQLSLLGDAKTSFVNLLKKLEKAKGVTFKLESKLKDLISNVPDANFKINKSKLNCKFKKKTNYSSRLIKELKNPAISYDLILKESLRRKNNSDKEAGLRILSSLVEKYPENGDMAREVAYLALEWGLDEHAYYLLRRIIKSRPNEPQNYYILAQVLQKMGYIDLAILYYEVIYNADWDSRFGDFHTIANVDYLHLLKQIKDKKLKSSFTKFTRSKLDTLIKIVGIDSADLVVAITWNTDFTDIDLHIKEPSGEVCYYGNRETKSGGKLTKDVTQGYGPEMYVLKKASAGVYKLKVNYYSFNREKASLRTKIYSKIYKNWGTKQEFVVKKSIVLNDKKETQNITKINFN